MNWLETRLDQEGAKHNAFYTALDPADFYEWRFSRHIPKGTKFTHTLPPSEVIADGMIVAAARIPSKLCIKQPDGTYNLDHDINDDIYLVVGNVSSPGEVFEKYKKLKKDFAKQTEYFRKSIVSQKYSVLPGGNLCSVDDVDSLANVFIFEKLPEIQKKLYAAKQALTDKVRNKTGRAYEMEKLRRFENIFTLIGNKGVIVDPVHMDYVLKIADVKPIEKRVVSWAECFGEFSTDARDKMSRISALDAMTWIKTAWAVE